MNFSKKRGQAFETMMLVISVIVALAILGVLMGILGGLNFGSSSSATEVMKKSLGEIGGKYSSGTVAAKANFAKGKNYEVQEVIQDNSVVLAEEVNFAYTPKVENLVEEAQPESFSVKSKAFDGVVVACSNPDKPDNPKYIIAIGAAGEEKTTTARCKEVRG